MAMARETIAGGISRPNARGRSWPRTVERTTTTLTMNEPTLMPPAADVDAPPMNISTRSAAVVESCSADMSTVAIPVVRFTERKKALASADTTP